MIKSIAIKNIALIEELELEFYYGLNIITGETGAGKSVLLNGIGLILGEKISPDTLRTGAQKGSVEVVFDISRNNLLKSLLAQSGIELEDNYLIVKREVTDDSRSRSFINLSSVPNSSLKHFGEYLLDISGQHDHQSLLRPQTHIDLLDNFGKLQKQRELFNLKFKELTELKAEYEDFFSSEEEKRKQFELNEFAIKEIEDSKIKPGEDQYLDSELQALTNFERITSTLESSYLYLYEQDHSVIPSTEKVIAILEKVADIDDKLKQASDELKEGLYILENVRDMIRTYKDQLDFSPDRLEEINQRLELIKDLKRKYGGGIEEILAHKEKCLLAVEKYSQNKDRMDSLNQNIDQLQNELKRMAIDLSKARQIKARELEKEIERELSYLGMEKTTFKIEFRYIQDENSFLRISDKGVKLEEKGIDRVEFIFSPNPGETPRPLSKIASGGELSRVMLAIKSILTEMDEIDTILFDEVDAGIGGEMAMKVSRKILDISSKRQVLCITHSPQIASKSQHHYFVDKSEDSGRTKTHIRKISEEEKVREIARMLSGEKISDITLEHARELISKH
ncbi:MAG: DNA repair protein RecN [Spirochaetota bacterium]|nr:DNA repair protein RecN [Spirochaetota bacterium]